MQRLVRRRRNLKRDATVAGPNFEVISHPSSPFPTKTSPPPQSQSPAYPAVTSEPEPLTAAQSATVAIR